MALRIIVHTFYHKLFSSCIEVYFILVFFFYAWQWWCRWLQHLVSHCQSRPVKDFSVRMSPAGTRDLQEHARLRDPKSTQA